MTTTKTKAISKIQRIQLNLLRESSFNDFDGPAVGDSLMEHRDLWIAFMIDREAYSAEYQRRRIYDEQIASKGEKQPELPVAPFDTIRLRDLTRGYWNVDALFILPMPGKEDELYALAHTWGADEIDWYDPLDASSVWLNEPKVGERIESISVEKMLRVWWD